MPSDSRFYEGLGGLLSDLRSSSAFSTDFFRRAIIP